jgi:hypothetical protein
MIVPPQSAFAFESNSAGETFIRSYLASVRKRSIIKIEEPEKQRAAAADPRGKENAKAK